MFAGARWLFVNQPLTSVLDAKAERPSLVAWTEFLPSGVTELWLKPNYASYEPGETRYADAAGTAA